MQVNPADKYGMSTSCGILRTLTNIDSKFIQPGFQYSFNMHEDKPYNYPSFLNLMFVNGYERKYNIGYSSLPNIKEEILYMNNLIEFERSMNGQDDELEDEA